MPSRGTTPKPVEYAALLSYVSPKRWSNLPSGSRRRNLNAANQYTLALKNDHNQPSQAHISIYDYVARTCAEQNHFSKFFSEEATLVPVPGSCPHKPGSMWAPELLANALKEHGLGRNVVAHLERVTPVPKSSQSADRVSPTKHRDTMAVKTTVTPPTNILLVDDVVTRGSTFLGSAWLMSEAYPDVEIKAFAAMRTCYVNGFKKLLHPCTGTIRLNQDMDPYKSPCMEVKNYTQTSLFDNAHIPNRGGSFGP